VLDAFDVLSRTQFADTHEILRGAGTVMQSRLWHKLLALGSIAAAGNAVAVTSPPRPSVQCTVTGAEKLPAEVGGAATICAAISSAAAQSALRGLRANVRVLGNSRLAATLSSAGGSILAERRFATSDRALTKGAIDRFARSLVKAAATMHHAGAH
jgi:hypothetical protein